MLLIQQQQQFEQNGSGGGGTKRSAAAQQQADHLMPTKQTKLAPTTGNNSNGNIMDGSEDPVCAHIGPKLPHVGIGTRAIHGGNHPERWDMNQVGANALAKYIPVCILLLKVVPPISLATTYKQPKPGQPIGHDYARAGQSSIHGMKWERKTAAHFQHLIVLLQAIRPGMCWRRTLHCWSMANIVSVPT